MYTKNLSPISQNGTKTGENFPKKITEKRDGFAAQARKLHHQVKMTRRSWHINI